MLSNHDSANLCCVHVVTVAAEKDDTYSFSMCFMFETYSTMFETLGLTSDNVLPFAG